MEYIKYTSSVRVRVHFAIARFGERLKISELNFINLQNRQKMQNIKKYFADHSAEKPTTIITATPYCYSKCRSYLTANQLFVKNMVNIKSWFPWFP